MSRFSQAMKTRAEQQRKVKTLPEAPKPSSPTRARAATTRDWNVIIALVPVVSSLNALQAGELAANLEICRDSGCQVVEPDAAAQGHSGHALLKIVRGELPEEEWDSVIKPLLVPFKEEIRQLLAWVSQGYAALQPACLGGETIAVIPGARESWRENMALYSIDEYLALRDDPAEFAAVHAVKKQFGGRLVSQETLPGAGVATETPAAAGVIA